MEKTQKKNYNVAWMMGHDIDDLEVCEDLNLDPSLAYTPQINKAATDAVYERNIQDGVRAGLSIEESTNQAKEARSNSHKLWSTLSKNKYA
jgi:hypothetical protein